MKDLYTLLVNRDLKELTKKPRHKFLDEITKRVNQDRLGTKYKPLSVKVIAIKTAHLSEEDLHFLLKKMSQSLSPGKIFFGSLKVRKGDIV